MSDYKPSEEVRKMLHLYSRKHSAFRLATDISNAYLRAWPDSNFPPLDVQETTDFIMADRRRIAEKVREACETVAKGNRLCSCGTGADIALEIRSLDLEKLLEEE